MRLFDKLKIEKGRDDDEASRRNTESLVYFPNSSRIMVDECGIIFSDHLPGPPVITRCFNSRKVVSTVRPFTLPSLSGPTSSHLFANELIFPLTRIDGVEIREKDSTAGVRSIGLRSLTWII